MIQAMTLADLSSIIVIENEAFSHPWTIDDFLIELQSNPYALYFVLIVNNTIVGYIGFWLIYEKAQITTIAIKSEEQGKHYAKDLLNFAFELCEQNNVEEISLEVRPSNFKAIGLYNNFGFQTKGIRKDYYQDNHEDAYLMIKVFKGA